MNTKQNIMKAASVFSYIGSFAWMLATAWCFSLSNTTYWLYLIFGVASLYAGLLVSTVRENMTNIHLSKPNQFLFYTVLSIVSPPAFVLNIIAFFWNKEDDYEIFMQKKDQKVAGNKNAKKTNRKKISMVVMVVGLCISLGASFVAMVFDTSFFQVKVSSFTLTKEMTEKYNKKSLNGQSFVIDNNELTYSVNMYVPKTASPENPAATVFVMPGFTRTKATMAQYCIELSRRGAVVFCIDPGSQGETTFAGYQKDENGSLLLDKDGQPVQISPTTQANGMNYLVQYVYNNTDTFNFLDRNRFGAVGHSAGGGNVVTTVAAFSGNSYEESIIKSLYVSGYIKLSSVNNYTKLNSNTALSYAYYDEGSFRYQTDTSAFEVVALRFINEIQGKNLNYKELIVGYPYGNISDGTYRIVHTEPINHSFEMYDPLSISNTIQFFDTTLGMNSTINANNQIWLGKETSNGIALIGGFIFVIALSAVLLYTSFFASVKGTPIKEAEFAADYEGAKKSSHKLIFWSSMLLTAIIACLDYIPLANLSISMFAKAAGNQYTYFFPARMFNAVLLWAAINGTIGLVLFFGILWVRNIFKKATAPKKELHNELVQLRPIKIGFVDLLKTFLLAVVLFAAFFLLVQVCKWLFGQDFRFMLISASTLTPRFFVTWLMYIPIMFIFYISNSIRVNCSIGFEDWPEWKVMLVGALANSIGLVFILIVHYVCFIKTGSVFYGYYGVNNNEVWLYVNIVFALIPMMFILPIFNRLYYKQTNRVWLGAFVNCMIFIMMALSATVSYIPM